MIQQQTLRDNNQWIPAYNLDNARELLRLCSAPLADIIALRSANDGEAKKSIALSLLNRAKEYKAQVPQEEQMRFPYHGIITNLEKECQDILGIKRDGDRD